MKAVRKHLAQESGQRKKFRGVFSRFGKKVNYKGYTETTLLFTNIIDIETNFLVTDHIWFTLTKGFEKLNFEEGTVIEFEARIKEYNKGYVNKKYGIDKRHQDYKLSNPTKINIIKEG